MGRDPLVSPHYLGERGNDYCEGYSRRAPDAANAKARLFQPFVKGADTVLDFGCASGEVLTSITCARRLGVEVNPLLLGLAREKGIQAYEALTDVPPSTVDVVISGHTLEHCLRPLDELVSMRGTLREGGRIVLVLPLDDWRTQRNMNANDVNHHLYAWTPLVLGNLLAEAGFVTEQIRVLTHAWPPLGTYRLWRLLPPRAFDAICLACAILMRRRQLLAVARYGP